MLSITLSLWEFMSLKHKVPQGYSPADENAGLAYAFRDDDIIKVGKYQTDSLPDSPLAAAPLSMSHSSLGASLVQKSQNGIARRRPPPPIFVDKPLFVVYKSVVTFFSEP